MAEIAGRKILVTGAHGFVAGHLIERLTEAGADVVGIDLWVLRQSYLNMSTAIRRTDLVECDIANLEQVQALFDEHRPEIVMHLAAQADMARAVANPLGTFEANVRGTYILLECARRLWQGDESPHAMVVASSDRAYGTHTHLPCREDDELLGLYPYDVSKACADMLARGYHEAWGVATGVVRCANVYGPGDLNFNRLIPGTFRSLLNGETPVIHSEHSALRDYMYIGDAVDGYVRVMNALLDARHPGEPFNFGTGDPVRVSELLREMLEIAGRPDLEPRVEGDASEKMHDQFLSAAKARRLLGWQTLVPRHEGLRRTFRWYDDKLPEIEG